MNRTIEQWQALRAAVGGTLLEDAVSDLQELARQRDELLGALELLLCDVEEAEYMTGREREAAARAVIQKVRGE